MEEREEEGAFCRRYVSAGAAVRSSPPFTGIKPLMVGRSPLAINSVNVGAFFAILYVLI